MTLDVIYEQVYLKLGKDAYGNVVTPDSFNKALSYANIEKLNDFLTVLEQDEEMIDNLRPFVITLGDNASSPIYLDEYGYAVLPSDYVRYVQSSRMDYTNNTTGSTEVYRLAFPVFLVERVLSLAQLSRFS